MLRWLMRLGRSIIKSIRPLQTAVGERFRPPRRAASALHTKTLTTAAGPHPPWRGRLRDANPAQARPQSAEPVVPPAPYHLPNSLPADPTAATPLPSLGHGNPAPPVFPRSEQHDKTEDASGNTPVSALADDPSSSTLTEINSEPVLPASVADEPKQAERQPAPPPAPQNDIAPLSVNNSKHDGRREPGELVQTADAGVAGTAAIDTVPAFDNTAEQAPIELPDQLAHEAGETAESKGASASPNGIAIITGDDIAVAVHPDTAAPTHGADATPLHAPPPEIAAQPATNGALSEQPDDIGLEPCGNAEIAAAEQQAAGGDEDVCSSLVHRNPSGNADEAMQFAGEAAAPATEPPRAVLAPATEALVEIPPQGRRRTAVHRDRRGSRRAAEAQKPAPPDQASAPVQRRPSELRLRLELDRRSQSAMLSAVAARGEGFPDAIAVGAAGDGPVASFDERRYDDVPLDWTGDLLRSEIRLRDQTKGLSWLHSARAVHIFTDEPGEPDLLSSAAAITGRRHVLIVPNALAGSVSALTELAGSPPLNLLAGWRGIPDGWSVLDGYVPVKPIAQEFNRDLKPLDPGVPVIIAFSGGLQIRGSSWAEGSQPEIRIDPLPANAAVTIGRQPAEQHADGRWTAVGYEAPGTHIVDVVPGPSASYTILPDPARAGEWNSAQGTQSGTVEICGASAVGSNGRPVLALASPGFVTAIGARGGIHILTQREGYSLSSGAPPFDPEFLLVSWGQRRTQGQIVWLGRPTGSSAIPSCGRWTAAVRAAAARQLAVVPDTPEARQAWRLTVAAARNPGRRSAP